MALSASRRSAAGIALRVGGDHDAHAGRDDELGVTDGDRLADAGPDPLGHVHRVVIVIHFGERDELVTAEAGHHVDATRHRDQPRRHLVEHQVAGGVVRPVVHQLEAVEVDEQQGQ